ncbi:MAG: hypothetical protein ACOZF0_19245 [Thermodesulfobacteriota bacterium]
MTISPTGIRIIRGDTNFLIIAPHGPFINGVHQNDLRTGLIAEEVQRRLGCSAIINDLYFKPKGTIKKDASRFFLDLFRRDHAAKVPGYLEAVSAVVRGDGNTLVVWIHGIADDVALARGLEHRRLGLYGGTPDSLHALIGYGQGGDPKTGDAMERPTMRKERAAAFRDELTSRGMTTLLTHPDSTHFRGRDEKRLNQWFVQQGYGFDQVESVQLEIRETGFRDSTENAVDTARMIANALACLRP